MFGVLFGVLFAFCATNVLANDVVDDLLSNCNNEILNCDNLRGVTASLVRLNSGPNPPSSSTVDRTPWTAGGIQEVFHDNGLDLTSEQAQTFQQKYAAMADATANSEQSMSAYEDMHDYIEEIFPTYRKEVQEHAIMEHGQNKIASSAGGVGGGDQSAAYISAAGATSRIAMKQLIIPAAKTRTEQKHEKAHKAAHVVRSIGASLSWEEVSFDQVIEDGDLIGATVGMAWDNDSISYGFMLPYENLDFYSFDANRIGVIGFMQIHTEMTDALSATFSGHLNYNYTDIEYDEGGSVDVSLYGGGVGVSLTFDKDFYVITGGALYLYNTDDSDVDNDEQHLIKLGVNTGIRLGENSVINLYGVWNYDPTSYDKPDEMTTDYSGTGMAFFFPEFEDNYVEDDDYYEFGVEGSYAFTETFSITVGYKTVVGLEDFDADQIYLGSIWKF